MIPLFAQAGPPIPSAETVWLAVISLVTVCSGLATIGIWWQGRGQPPSPPAPAEIQPAVITRADFVDHVESSRRELDEIRATGRAENTAIRHEITEAVQHSQEMLMDKLEKNRLELSAKLDRMPSRIITDLNNAKHLLE
jgi:hypothetical protein